MAKLKCVYKMPGGPAHIGEIPNRLKDYQFFVDGYVQAVPLSCGAVLICNEEGKRIGMERNFYLKDRNTGKIWDYVSGPVVIVNTDEEGEFTDIDDEAAEQICNVLNFQPALEVG